MNLIQIYEQQSGEFHQTFPFGKFIFETEIE